MIEATTMRRHDRRALFVLLVVTGAALTGCGTGAAAPGSSAPTPVSSPATASPSPTPTPPIGPAEECDAGRLELSLQSRPMDSGMGSFFWDLTLTNTSGTTCTLAGYPELTLLNANTGGPAGAASEHEPVPSVTEAAVPVPPGASAYSLVHLNQAGAYGCPIVPVTEVAVTLPSGDAAGVVATPNQIDGCDDPTKVILRAGPIAAAPVTF